MTDPPVEWEHREVSRETGKQTTMKLKVPRLLEPKDPGDWTEGEDIVVCNGNNPQRRDIIFVGDPTPDMEPIDDEAKKITKEFIDSGKWKKPEFGVEYGEQLIQSFMEQIVKLQNAPVPVQPVSAGVDAKAFADLQGQVKALAEQNAKLQAQALRRP